jgi:hypothetical protein
MKLFFLNRQLWHCAHRFGLEYWYWGLEVGAGVFEEQLAGVEAHFDILDYRQIKIR